jgi:hypothetical protein
VLAGEHLAPAERPYAWLGSQKASRAAAALIARLGDDAPPMLTRLQVNVSIHYIKTQDSRGVAPAV